MAVKRLRKGSWCFALAAAVVAICGCATREPAPAAKDPAWVADLIRHPSGPWGSECVRSALDTSYALVDFRESRVDDDKVSSALLHGATAPALHTARSEEAALWRQTHDPAITAAHQLSACMGWQGVKLIPSPVWQTCLRRTEAVELLWLHRVIGRTRPAAIEADDSQFSGEWSSEAIRAMAARVYAAPTEADDLRIREGVFADCLAPAPQ